MSRRPSDFVTGLELRRRAEQVANHLSDEVKDGHTQLNHALQWIGGLYEHAWRLKRDQRALPIPPEPGTPFAALVRELPHDVLAWLERAAPVAVAPVMQSIWRRLTEIDREAAAAWRERLPEAVRDAMARSDTQRIGSETALQLRSTPSQAEPMLARPITLQRERDRIVALADHLLPALIERTTALLAEAVPQNANEDAWYAAHPQQQRGSSLPALNNAVSGAEFAVRHLAPLATPEVTIAALRALLPHQPRTLWEFIPKLRWAVWRAMDTALITQIAETPIDLMSRARLAIYLENSGTGRADADRALLLTLLRVAPASAISALETKAVLRDLVTPEDLAPCFDPATTDQTTRLRAMDLLTRLRALSVVASPSADAPTPASPPAPPVAPSRRGPARSH